MNELDLYQNLLGSTNALNSVANRGATTQSTINLNDVLKTAMEEEDDDDEDSSLITDVENLPDNLRVVDGEIRYKTSAVPTGYKRAIAGTRDAFGWLLGMKDPETGRPYDLDRRDPPSIKDFPVESLIKEGKGAKDKDVFDKKLDRTLNKLLETNFKQQQLNLALEEQAQPLRMARALEMGKQGLMLAAAAQRIRDSSDPARQQQMTEAAKLRSIQDQTNVLKEQVATERAIKNFYERGNY